jgi:hypothetical protein
MASPILGWASMGRAWPVNSDRRWASSKISMGMKKADSPIASQMAHFARNASPCRRPAGTIRKAKCRLQDTHIGRRDGVQPVADVAEKTPFRVEVNPAQKLVEHIRQIFVCQRKNAAAASSSASTTPLVSLIATMKYSVGAGFFGMDDFACSRSSADFGQQPVQKFRWQAVPACRRRGNGWSPCPSTPAFRRACQNQSSRRTACPPRPGGVAAADGAAVVVKHIHPRAQQVAHFASAFCTSSGLFFSSGSTPP